MHRNSVLIARDRDLSSMLRMLSSLLWNSPGSSSSSGYEGETGRLPDPLVKRRRPRLVLWNSVSAHKFGTLILCFAQAAFIFLDNFSIFSSVSNTNKVYFARYQGITTNQYSKGVILLSQ